MNPRIPTPTLLFCLALACAAQDDLPCDGADFQTDDQNCGECGNTCLIEYPDTPYSAGHCVGGECGPRWVEDYVSSTDTCDEVCAANFASCVRQGCSGMTAYRCQKVFGYGCEIDQGALPAPWYGACSEAISWEDMEQIGEWYVGCCCDH